ncbi:hypothetical protein TWF481_009472 [Arthrobotrys musiformis]|uniref:Uncharacterized protein n=1 Tax=Arthrobotrys musiformis TaxID=47236 RepID=A0AAV9W558_9PEZI
MKPTFVHSFLCLALAGTKFVDAYVFAPGCGADNCARGVTGTAVKVAMASRIADCSKFMGAMGPAPVTVTNTIMKTVTTSTTVGTKTETVTASGAAEEPEETAAASKAEKADTDKKLRRRYGYEADKDGKPAVATTAATTAAAVVINIPAYASHCSGAVRYSSVCSCWGIKKGTAAPTTETEVVTKTTTEVIKVTAVVQKAAVVCSKTQEKCGETCKNVFTDVKNCGACDKKCKDGATCVNGVCSEPACDDVKEWQCDNESKKGCNGASGDETFCMKGTKASFCTSFANLPLCPKEEKDGCKTDADCGKGQVCGHIACCGWNICIKPHHPDATGGSYNKASTRRLFKRENKNKLRKLAQEN